MEDSAPADGGMAEVPGELSWYGETQEILRDTVPREGIFI